MLNNFTVQGRLTEPPTLLQTDDGVHFCKFRIACERSVPSRNGERETDYFDCKAWRKVASHIFNYYKKGDCILVQGRMMQRSFEEAGAPKTVYEVQVEDVNFPDSKKKES